MATKQINLALQGGGAHGAFTWGVLDRLLEEDDVEISAISGTSAGALNGAALKSGLDVGGNEAARENLDWLWSRIGASHDTSFPDWFYGGFDAGQISRLLKHSPFFSVADTWGRLTSPYMYGPFYAHPLRPIVDEFNFDRVCSTTLPDLFICATNVRSGKIRVFSGPEITTDAILASGCLPTIFKAVELVDPKSGVKEAFWDGGYTGNPALYPLFRPDLPQDIVIVNINPLYRPELPQTPHEIQNRLNEISFNSSLFRELRAISFVQQLFDEGRMDGSAMKVPRIHMIADDVLMNDLTVATKLIPIRRVLDELKVAGRRAAAAFLDDHKADLNVNQTAKLDDMFN